MDGDSRLEPSSPLASAADFVAHSLLSVTCALLLSVFIGAFVNLFYDGRRGELATPVVAAIALAVLSSRWIRSSVALWVWVFPLLWFLLGVYELTTGWSASWDPSSSRWAYAGKELFTTQCSSTECLYEFFCSMPLLASVAYAITYAVLLNRPGERNFRRTWLGG